MSSSQKNYNLFILLGDIAVFYFGLYLTLSLRYQEDFSRFVWNVHTPPFFIIHILWILIFYINGLYDIKSFSSQKKIFEKVGRSMFIAGLLAVLIFYLVPSFKITPRTNLLLDIVIVSFLLALWRKIFFLVSANFSKTRILFLGASNEVFELISYIKNNPQMGYETAGICLSKNFNKGEDLDEADKFAAENKIKIFPFKNGLTDLVQQNNINIIAVLEDIMNKNSAAKKLYDVLRFGASVMNFSDFYELIMEKIPVSLINENWFLANINEGSKKANKFFKRFFDTFFALFFGILFLLIAIPLAIIIKFTRGRIFYFQKRVGRNGDIFNLVKFGSMVLDAEKYGVKWAEKNDPRVTKFGGFLRKTRLDELPQLWNILKGEMSFVGPRPERPEFVEDLEKKIPHYLMRHLVKPGLSGWAQIKLVHGGAGEEALAKLQYDLYYIKNRTIIFDLAIALKTIAIIIKREGL